MYRTAFNTGDTPVVIDSAGRVIGGGEWGTVDTTDDQAKPLLDSEALVLVDIDTKADGLDPRAVDAAKRTEAISKRQDALKGLGNDDLKALAVENGLLNEDADLNKSELVSLLAPADIDVPTAHKQRSGGNEKE